MKKSATTSPALQERFADHSRHWRDFDYVYPVLSRRSGGLSIGINLNPDQACTNDCIYCQVNRQDKPKRRDVDENQLLQELKFLLDFAACGEIYRTPEFAGVPPEWRRVNDVAFSGNGEPTGYPGFPALVTQVAEVLKNQADRRIKIVLITNAGLLDRPEVKAALRVLDENNGEVWAKLDVGSEAYYRRVNRSAVPFVRILDNLLACAKERPVVIQSLFMKIHGAGPASEEIESYRQRLRRIISEGGRIKLVQVYTVVRATAEKYVHGLENAELDAIAERIRETVPGTAVEVYYGI